MGKLILTACCAICAGLTLFAFAPQKPSPEYTTPEIREQQEVVVRGSKETWQLKWTSPPKPICEPSDTSLSSPCTGFGFGEGGDLVLIRLLNGFEIDRLDLTPLFEEEFAGTGRVAIVQRWQPDWERDFDAALSDDDFPNLVAKRPADQVMHFADYDHDGEKSEFFLQTTTFPGPKMVGVVIGVTGTNQRLHSFGTASEPSKALYMQKTQWDALREASGPVEVPDWTCGDHGNDMETTRLSWTPGGINGTFRGFTCPPEPRRLIRVKPL